MPLTTLAEVVAADALARQFARNYLAERIAA
jgi:hypothetical protein